MERKKRRKNACENFGLSVQGPLDFLMYIFICNFIITSIAFVLL